METAINYCTLDAAYVSSDEPRWKKRILKLAEAYPDDVTLLRRPEVNDGCIYATVPVKWIRIMPPKRMSDESKARHAEIFRQYREQVKKNEELS